MTDDDRAGQLASTLAHAERVHGVVSERTGGRDPDWALFYAWWLLNWSDLPELVVPAPGLAELTARLIEMDRVHRAGGSGEAWPAVYARQLLAG